MGLFWFGLNPKGFFAGTLGAEIPAQHALPAQHPSREANDGEETAGLANTLILLAEEASMLVCGWFVSKLLITEALLLPAFSHGQARARSLRPSIRTTEQ